MTDVKVFDLLQKPFEDGQIGKLPRTTCRKCSDAPGKVCADHSKSECPVCGNYMTNRHIHLDYVGHAQVTARLLEADPEWTWEPCGWTAEGNPAVRVEQGGRAVLWIRLTVGGVTRLGVGIVGSGKPECEKELIGDALRNAAMRFGVALDLWAKGDLHGEDSEAPSPSPQAPEPPSVDWKHLGWEDQSDYDETYAEVAEAARALTNDNAKAAIKSWLTEFAKPYSRDVLDEWQSKVEEQAVAEAGGLDESGPP